MLVIPVSLAGNTVVRVNLPKFDGVTSQMFHRNAPKCDDLHRHLDKNRLM